LPYPPHQTGLHLHGINFNTTEFLSLPPPQVADFAKEYGFITTGHLTFDTLDEVKHFTESCGQTGTWNGEHVEGFVIRCKRRGAKDDREVFMWKVKFDEPYLMWREWRELTRKLLTARRKKTGDAVGAADGDETPAIKVERLKRPETRLYVEFVKRMLDERPGMFDEWQYGRGIVKTRDEFFAWCDTEEGKREAQRLSKGKGQAQVDCDGDDSNSRPFDKTLLVPIAIPGCGM
jgi:tRNA ligase